MTTVSFEYGENKDTCIWNGLFNNEERVTLQQGFLFTGLY